MAGDNEEDRIVVEYLLDQDMSGWRCYFFTDSVQAKKNQNHVQYQSKKLSSVFE
ncbi:MAG: hypothetical protein ACJA02_000648 [Myxococcota bacterium]